MPSLSSLLGQTQLLSLVKESLDINSSNGLVKASITLLVSWETARYLYSLYVDKTRYSSMISKVSKGTEERKSARDVVLTRDSALCNLSYLMDTSKVGGKGSHSYFVVTGGVGVGKTSLVHAAAQRAGSGVVFVTVPEDDVGRFGLDFAKACGFKFDEGVSFWKMVQDGMFGFVREDAPVAPSAVEDEVLHRFLPFFKKLARKFFQRHGIPLTLVLDDVHLLLESSPRVLHTLQSVAKRGADDGFLKVVFVCPFGVGFKALLDNYQLASRMTVYQVHDIAENEAKAFLNRDRRVDHSTCLRRRTLECESTNTAPLCKELSESEVDQIIKVTGCRLSLLNTVDGLIKRGISVKDACRQLIDGAMREIYYHNHPFHKPFEENRVAAISQWKGAILLVDEGPAHVEVFFEVTGFLHLQLPPMFVVNGVSGLVTFLNQSFDAYCRQVLGEKDTPRRQLAEEKIRRWEEE